MTSKERAVYKAQAMKIDSIFQIGKSSLTPHMIDAVRDALRARELVKVSVLKNCLEDPRELAEVLAQRTGSEVVQVIGKKIVLYKRNYEAQEKRRRAAKQEQAGSKRRRTAKPEQTESKRTRTAKPEQTEPKRTRTAKPEQTEPKRTRNAKPGQTGKKRGWDREWGQTKRTRSER